MVGASIRQGPHHSAQKSTSTGPVCWITSCSKFESVNSFTFSLAIITPVDQSVGCLTQDDRSGEMASQRGWKRGWEREVTILGIGAVSLPYRTNSVQNCRGRRLALWRFYSAAYSARMIGGADRGVRAPAVAGRFYPADERHCRAMAESYLKNDRKSGNERSIGGIVPHAGWICSGAIAGEVISCLARESKPDVVVIFGAVHTPIPIASAALDTHAAWSVPTGTSTVPAELEAKLLEAGDL